MTLFESILLGLVQGLAEFLPVSSSGHLAILQSFFGIEGESVLSFAVLLHLGTLFSLIAVYYKDIWELIKELGAVFGDLFTGKGLRVNANPTRKLGFMIIVATIPTGLAGVLLSDFFSGLYNSMLAVSVCLIITGTFLFIVERLPRKKKDMDKEIRGAKFRSAFVVGLFQSVAICPGISRSGATIVGGLFSGFTRELAVRFAFLISIPPIIGAVVLEAPAAFETGLDTAILIPVIAGVLTAAVSGYLAIRVMISLVTNKGLKVFSFYTWILGGALLIYTLFIA